MILQIEVEREGDLGGLIHFTMRSLDPATTFDFAESTVVIDFPLEIIMSQGYLHQHLKYALSEEGILCFPFF